MCNVKPASTSLQFYCFSTQWIDCARSHSVTELITNGTEQISSAQTNRTQNDSDPVSIAQCRYNLYNLLCKFIAAEIKYQGSSCTKHRTQMLMSRQSEFLMSENTAVVSHLTPDKQLIFINHFLTTQVAILQHIHHAISIHLVNKVYH